MGATPKPLDIVEGEFLQSLKKSNSIHSFPFTKRIETNGVKIVFGCRHGYVILKSLRQSPLADQYLDRSQ